MLHNKEICTVINLVSGHLQVNLPQTMFKLKVVLTILVLLLRLLHSHQQHPWFHKIEILNKIRNIQISSKNFEFLLSCNFNVMEKHNDAHFLRFIVIGILSKKKPQIQVPWVTIYITGCPVLCFQLHNDIYVELFIKVLLPV